MSNYLKSCSASLSHSTECLLPNFHPEFLSGSVEGEQLQRPWFKLCKDIGKYQFQIGRAPSRSWIWPWFGGITWPFLSHGARNGHSQVSCPQSLPASQYYTMSQLFPWSGQSTGVSALASFLPKKSQGWSPSEWTGWIYLQCKGLSRVFSNNTVQKHQFFGAQLSSQSNSHIHTWPLEKP